MKGYRIAAVVSALAIAAGASACSSSNDPGEGSVGSNGAATSGAPKPNQPARPEFLPILGTFECNEGTLTVSDDTFTFDASNDSSDLDVSGTWSADGSMIHVTLDDGTEVPVSYEIGEDPDGEWETFYGVFRAASEEPATVTIQADDSDGSGGMMTLSVEIESDGYFPDWSCDF